MPRTQCESGLVGTVGHLSIVMSTRVLPFLSFTELSTLPRADSATETAANRMIRRMGPRESDIYRDYPCVTLLAVQNYEPKPTAVELRAVQ